jgi:hypothetical protein
MGKLMSARLAATVVQTVEVQLKPSLKRKLLNELTVYAGLDAQIKALEAQLATHKATIEECLIESGEEKLEIEGHKTTMVFPKDRTPLDKKLFVQNGGTLAQLAAASPPVPATPYLRITPAGQKERTSDE